MTYTSWSVVFGEQPSAAKWNILGSNDAHFYSFLGDNLAYQSYTPTLTNLSGGSMVANYTQVGKTVFVFFKYVLAGAGVSGTPRVTLPVTANSKYTASANSNVDLGTVWINDVGSNNYYGVPIMNSTTTGLTAVDIYVWNAGSSYPAVSAPSSTVPFTWGANDTILMNLRYEGA